MKHILHGFLSQGIFGRFLEKKYSQIARMGLSILLVFTSVIIVSTLIGEAYSTFTPIFLSIFIEAVPFLLAGAIVSGLIHVLRLFTPYFHDSGHFQSVGSAKREECFSTITGVLRIWCSHHSGNACK